MSREKYYEEEKLEIDIEILEGEISVAENILEFAEKMYAKAARENHGDNILLAWKKMLGKFDRKIDLKIRYLNYYIVDLEVIKQT